jgi:nitroreductase
LGTCWVCNFDAKLCHELFGFGVEEEPAVLIPLGYPAEDFVAKEKTRKTIEEITKVFWRP